MLDSASHKLTHQMHFTTKDTEATEERRKF